MSASTIAATAAEEIAQELFAKTIVPGSAIRGAGCAIPASRCAPSMRCDARSCAPRHRNRSAIGRGARHRPAPARTLHRANGRCIQRRKHGIYNAYRMQQRRSFGLREGGEGFAGVFECAVGRDEERERTRPEQHTAQLTLLEQRAEAAEARVRRQQIQLHTAKRFERRQRQVRQPARVLTNRKAKRASRCARTIVERPAAPMVQLATISRTRALLLPARLDSDGLMHREYRVENPTQHSPVQPAPAVLQAVASAAASASGLLQLLLSNARAQP